MSRKNFQFVRSCQCHLVRRVYQSLLPFVHERGAPEKEAAVSVGTWSPCHPAVTAWAPCWGTAGLLPAFLTFPSSLLPDFPSTVTPYPYVTTTGIFITCHPQHMLYSPGSAQVPAALTPVQTAF